MTRIEDEQEALWNGPAGRAWVDEQEVLDRVLRPFEELLVGAAAGRVLDVGCGTGSTTVAFARKTGARCVGVDISEPMLRFARARAEREGVAVEFVRADAQTYAFEPGSFDRILSRFGVMFFGDPVRAFANLRRAGGELRFVAWRSANENPFMTTAERAAARGTRADPGSSRSAIAVAWRRSSARAGGATSTCGRSTSSARCRSRTCSGTSRGSARSAGCSTRSTTRRARG
jgi:SAM-dependent methyltransferase